MLSTVSKQKMLAAPALLSGAIIWGLIWYPYRLLGEAGISGALSSLLTYVLPLALALIFFSSAFGQVRRSGWLLICLGLFAGWTNLAYVLAVIQGEVMRVLLLFYLSPLWTIVFARLLLRERLTLAGYGVMALSLGGALVMLWHPESSMPLPRNLAEWLALSAGLSFALTNVLSRKGANFDIALKSVSVWLGVALLSLLALLWTPLEFKPLLSLSLGSVAWLLLIGAVIFIVTLTVQFGLAHTTANQAIVIFLFELVVAAISSYVLAGESMTAQEWLGGVMIVAASLFSGKLSGSEHENH